MGGVVMICMVGTLLGTLEGEIDGPAVGDAVESINADGDWVVAGGS